MKRKDILKNGIYLVVDPSLALHEMLDRLKLALDGGVDIVQIIDNWGHEDDQHNVVNLIAILCHSYDVPVIINNHWQLLKELPLNGVHFDNIPPDYDQLRVVMDDAHMIGITCGNDLGVVKWAHEHNLDYISFCSMFPSSSVDTCEIVAFETIKKARKITDIPIFLSGGINIDNLPTLASLPFNGIAVISGIMKAQDPAQSTKEYISSLRKIGIQ